MKTGVILQPSYIPWRGYFDLVHEADVFVFYDDVQYDKHGWRNRNRIKTPQGSQWLTIPVSAKGNLTEGLLVKDARTASRDWRPKHLRAIEQNYARAPFLADHRALLQEIYGVETDNLADFTIPSTIAIARALGIDTNFVRSSELDIDPGLGRTRRLVSILRAIGVDRYVSGPSARDYIERDLFEEAGVELIYKTYDYEPYEQLHPPFDPQVTVLDLLLMKGSAASSLIWK